MVTMAIFNHIPMGEKGLFELFTWIDNYVKSNKEFAIKRIAGRSQDHKLEIPAVFVTNKNIPDDNKQISIITLARHGQERGARVVGPEILNYLSTNDAKPIRDKQIVIIVPILNPEGFILDEFHSSMYGITDTEKEVLGNLCNSYHPDMMVDYHSLGRLEGSKYDHGDMEVIIPANTTKWGMDEQIYKNTADRMVEYCALKGWPFEVHTLEDLANYYFGDQETGKIPWKYLKEKVYLLNIQDFYENYNLPNNNNIGYTNYTCGPAYLKWHTLVFGIETNHWSLKAEDIAMSGLAPCVSLLKMGQEKFPWEKTEGFPINLLYGDFRISIRAIGNSRSEIRKNREEIWNEKDKFNILQRELINPETTLARIGYTGDKFPLRLALCLRMRQKTIKRVLIEDKKIPFETFKDVCSTFVYIPLLFKKTGLLKIKIIHEIFNNDYLHERLI
ncbi:hypothetical protein JW865_08445 [Candidatus Bathyarchaeota archaeon]|nr:hypothetical protein [Candidatus Bathyarchaeota archaeon]